MLAGFLLGSLSTLMLVLLVHRVYRGTRGVACPECGRRLRAGDPPDEQPAQLRASGADVARCPTCGGPARRIAVPAVPEPPADETSGFRWGDERFPEDFGFRWGDEGLSEEAEARPDHPSGFRFNRN